MTPLVHSNGTPLPQASEIGPSSSAFVDSARNSLGIMIGGVIRDDVSKFEMIWKFLSVEDWKAVHNVPFISAVRFFDPKLADFNTKQMYRSDLTSKITLLDHETKLPRGYFDCRVAFIEV
jgi:hypothetical protein